MRRLTLCALGILIVVIFAGCSSPPEGPGQRFPSQGGAHISPGDSHPPYNSVPATSGWHYSAPFAPAPWGIYTEVIPDEVLLHNLEHGGIAIHYNCPDGCDELVQQLTETANNSRRDNLKVLLSPYPDMPTRIALTAWTFLDAFDEFDENRIEDFISAHESSSNAPEPDVP